MARVRRIDIGQLAKPIRRADGTLIAQAKFARTGVQSYADPSFPGGIRREYRPDDAVFDKQSIESFKLVPVTNGHPPEMLTSENAGQYSKGAVGQDIHRDGDWMVGTIAVHDANTIRGMDAGVNQVSNGYDCDLLMQSGTTPSGEKYDAIQSNIVGNHLAIVANARAGKDAAVRMDALCWDNDLSSGFEKAHKTDEDEKEDYMDLTQALAALAAAQKDLGAATARAVKADADLADAKKRLDALEGERDELKSRADKAETARKDAMDGQAGLVAARVALLTSATAVLGPKIARTDGAEVPLSQLDDRALKLAIIKHVTDADCDVDGSGKKRTDEYINARYDGAIERASESRDTFRGANDVIVEGRKHDSSHRSDTEKAYEEMVKANRDGWRTVDASAK